MTALLTPAEMAKADAAAIASGTPGIVLMEQAGNAVARFAASRLPRRIQVVAGPGNNGGDGFVAARLLAAQGFAVAVRLAGDPARLKGDAAQAFARWQGPVGFGAGDIAGADLVIDALFGAGLERPVEGEAAALIAAINASGGHVLSVDLPSGIDGTTGAVLGTAVRAQDTVTFFRKKPGHLLFPGREYCGAVHVSDIGISDAVLAGIGPSAFENDSTLWRSLLPVPPPAGHKYTRGHVVVGSGGLTSTGAARLAARGALRAGAGLVTIASPADALAVSAAASLAVMVRQVDTPHELTRLLASRRANTVILGPGGGVGEGMRGMVLAALASEVHAVLDADALTSFEDRPDVLAAAIRPRHAATILTPHHGEFERIFSVMLTNANVKDKLSRARAAAAGSGAVVVYKGPDTVVAAPNGTASIAANAPPSLATAGSGDVLAGFIAGLLAQGMPAFAAASAAVWLHGEVATAFGPGLIAEDLPDGLPGVYRTLLGRSANGS